MIPDVDDVHVQVLSSMPKAQHEKHVAPHLEHSWAEWQGNALLRQLRDELGGEAQLVPEQKHLCLLIQALTKWHDEASVDLGPVSASTTSRMSAIQFVQELEPSVELVL